MQTNAVQACGRVYVCCRQQQHRPDTQAPPRLHQAGGASTRQQARQVLSTRAARTAQVARSYVVDTKTGISKLDPIRTSYGAAIT